MDLAKVAFRKIRLNYSWALGFNCLGIPLAAGVVYPVWKVRIPPYAAAVAMAASSLTVVGSSIFIGEVSEIGVGAGVVSRLVCWLGRFDNVKLSYGTWLTMFDLVEIRNW